MRKGEAAGSGPRVYREATLTPGYKTRGRRGVEAPIFISDQKKWYKTDLL